MPYKKTDGGSRMIRLSFSATMEGAVCVLLLAMLAACSTVVVKSNVTPSAQLNAQAREFPAPEYLIQVGDELEIQFRYNPDLNQKLPVRPDGRISLPIVKEVLVSGMSPGKLAELLTDKYRQELRRPDVTVIVHTFPAQRVFVDGEVLMPNLITLTGGSLTVMQAIAQARGLKDTARRTQVLVIRQNPAGPAFTAVVDITKVIDGTDKSQDITLMPNDIVYVPRSAIANVDLWVDLYIRKMLPFALPSPVPTPVSTSSSW
jgi:protein involved in polysaccharide export with SLBB domain